MFFTWLLLASSAASWIPERGFAWSELRARPTSPPIRSPTLMLSPVAATEEPASTSAGPPSNRSPAAEDVTFPAELTAMERLVRAADFWFRVLPVLASYLRLYFSFEVREKVLGQCLDADECEVLWGDAHNRGASVLESAINDLKGFYVKCGQVIASRQDLFPRQYTEQLAGLTDFLDPMPTALVRAVIVQELLNEGEAFEDVFAQFDERPLGAASVAQVHRAVLTEAYGGGEVAVKVQASLASLT